MKKMYDEDELNGQESECPGIESCDCQGICTCDTSIDFEDEDEDCADCCCDEQDEDCDEYEDCDDQD